MNGKNEMVSVNQRVSSIIAIENGDSSTERSPADSHNQGRKVKENTSIVRKRWLCCTWFLTWWIPTYFIRKCGKMKNPEIQIAWREKVALNILIIFSCGILLFYIIGLGKIVCPKQNVLSQGEIDGKTEISNPYVSIFGSYYVIPPIVQSHVNENGWLNEKALEKTTLGQDVSAMFYKTTIWSKYCPNLPQPVGWDNIVRTVPEKAINVWNFHSEKDSQGKKKDYIGMISFMKKGEIARDRKWITSFLADDPVNNFIIIAYGRVYDISTYMAQGSQANFLGPNMKKIFSTFGASGGDATKFIEQIKKAEGFEKWKNYMQCMNGLLYAGVVDTRNSPQCQFSNYMLLVSTIVLVLIIGIKFISALQCADRRDPEDHDKFVILAVPCYTEGSESLIRTLESLSLSRYNEKRKLIFIVADGMVTGGGNDAPTPQILLKVLGWHGIEPEPRVFQSLGEGSKQMNQAKVYSGLYLVEGRFTPYVVVVKIGNEQEITKPGNRGKRDSQMIILQLLSRANLNQPMNPLELEIYHHIKNIIGFLPQFFEYILWVDADTEIYNDSINRMVSCMISDGKIVGICGETLIRNESASWVTMIQVYEYFISHHLAKSFESMFGSVTCLPGCFSMYRLKLGEEAFIIHPNVIKGYGENKIDTLHMKNLLSLGEDRYLTTLMMKNFPGFKLTFTQDAKALTVVPEKWSVLMSQRRRWINSTVHNLLELLFLSDLCGFCLFSMRFVIFMDLFATVVQPAGMVYVIYLVYATVTDEDQAIPVVSLIMIGAIYGLQVVIFLFKQEWQHIGWMIIYILAMPLYAFYLPLYSFWHFDDFSWGNTRVVATTEGTEEVIIVEEEEFDSSVIPLMKWDDFEQEMDLHLNQETNEGI